MTYTDTHIHSYHITGPRCCMHMYICFVLCNCCNCNCSLLLRMCIWFCVCVFFVRLIFMNTTWQQTQFFVDCNTLFIICFVCFFQLTNLFFCMFAAAAILVIIVSGDCSMFIFHIINISTESNKFSRVDVLLRLLSVLTVNLKEFYYTAAVAVHRRRHRQSTENVGEM